MLMPNHGLNFTTRRRQEPTISISSRLQQYREQHEPKKEQEQHKKQKRNDRQYKQKNQLEDQDKPDSESPSFPIRAFNDVSFISYSKGTASVSPAASTIVELGKIKLDAFPSRIPKSRIEATTVNRILDRLLGKSRKHTSTKAGSIGFSIPPIKDIHSHGAPGLELEWSEKAHDVVLADLLQQASGKARRLENHLAQRERYERHLESSLAASQAENQEKERKLLLRALEKKAMSKELHQMMEAMAPEASNAMLAGKSVTDMMADLKNKTMAMHDEDIKRIDAFRRMHEEDEQKLKKIRDSLKAEHEQFELMKAENQLHLEQFELMKAENQVHLEEAREMAAQAREQKLEAQRVKEESEKNIKEIKRNDRNVLLWVRAAKGTKQNLGTSEVGGRRRSQLKSPKSRDSPTRQSSGTETDASAVNGALGRTNLIDESSLQLNEVSNDLSHEILVESDSAKYLAWANEILKKCNEPHLMGVQCEQQIDDVVGDLMNGKILVRLLNYKLQPAEFFDPDKYDKDLLKIEDEGSDKERFCASVARISGLSRNLALSMYRMKPGPEKAMLLTSMLGALLEFGAKPISQQNGGGEGAAKSGHAGDSREEDFDEESDSGGRRDEGSRRKQRDAPYKFSMDRKKTKEGRKKLKLHRYVSIDNLVWKSKVSVKDLQPDHLKEIRSTIAEIYAEKTIEQSASKEPLPLATFTRQWFLRKHGIRTMTDNRLAVLAVGVVAHPEDARLRLFGKLSGINPDNYKKKRARPANFSIMHETSTCSFFLKSLQAIYSMISNKSRLVGSDQIFVPLEVVLKSMKVHCFPFSAGTDKYERLERTMQRHAKDDAPPDPVTGFSQINIDFALEEIVLFYPFELQCKLEHQSSKIASFVQKVYRGMKVRKKISLQLIELQVKAHQEGEISYLEMIMTSPSFTGCGKSFEKFSSLCGKILPGIKETVVTSLYEAAHDFSSNADDIHEDAFTAHGLNTAIIKAGYFYNDELKTYVLDDPEGTNTAVPAPLFSPRHRSNSVFGDVWSGKERRMTVMREMSQQAASALRHHHDISHEEYPDFSDSESDVGE